MRLHIPLEFFKEFPLDHKTNWIFNWVEYYIYGRCLSESVSLEFFCRNVDTISHETWTSLKGLIYNHTYSVVQNANTYFFHIFTESREKATKLDSELEVLKIENEKQKLENEQNIQNAQRDLSSTIASLEVRQSELVERLKVSWFFSNKYPNFTIKTR